MKIFNKISREVDSLNTENKNNENDYELNNLNIQSKMNNKNPFQMQISLLNHQIKILYKKLNY